jgi:hypothetical protein
MVPHYVLFSNTFYISCLLSQMVVCQSALQPWVSLGLLYNQSPLLGF